MDKMKIAILCGGFSGERNVSFTSGRAVFNALIELGHEVLAIDPAKGEDCLVNFDSLDIPNEIPELIENEEFSPSNFINCIKSNYMKNLDFVFNLVHGQYGEDGRLAAILDLQQIKYTGSKFRASALAMDKSLSKRLFQSIGIATPEWVVVNPESAKDLDLIKELRNDLGRELVIKPADQGSALGMTIIKTGNLDEIADAISFAGMFTQRIIIEEYIAGREITVAILGDETLPIVEISPKDGFYDYTNKYTSGKTEYICPADLPEDVSDFVSNMALSAHRILGLKGYSRIDFRLNDDYIPYCLEANTVPGMTELSLFPMACKAADISFNEMCEKIIDLS